MSQHSHSHSHAHHGDGGEGDNATIHALLATLVISLAPLVILFAVSLFQTEAPKMRQRRKLKERGARTGPFGPVVLATLVSFAVGGLLGDAFLHLIPHALEPHGHNHQDHHHHGHRGVAGHDHEHDQHVHKHHHSDESASHIVDDHHDHHHDDRHGHDHHHDDHHGHDHHHDDHHGHDHHHPSRDHTHGGVDGYDHHDHWGHTRVGLLVLAGMLTFFLLEKWARLTGAGHTHTHSHDHALHHTHGGSDSESNEDEDSSTARRSKRVAMRKRSTKIAGRKTSSKAQKQRKTRSKAAEVIPEPLKQQQRQQLQVAGWLNIIADTTHNFTDGLAIAASFSASYATGMSTTLAVLVHEVPHEIGDYAILIQSGYSTSKAMAMQLVTAIGAFAGVGVGVLTGSIPEQASFVLPFTAGGFIYIATADVIPTLMVDTSVTQTIREVLAMSLGVMLMVLIGVYLE